MGGFSARVEGRYGYGFLGPISRDLFVCPFDSFVAAAAQASAPILRSTGHLTAPVDVGEGDAMLEIRLRIGSLTNVLINAGALVLAIKKDPHMATHVSERFAETNRFKVLKEDDNGTSFTLYKSTPQYQSTREAKI